MKLAWTADLHLVFLGSNGAAESDELGSWLEHLAQQPFDALAISGDISEAPHLQEHLALLQSYVARPIYFVLGNHDYYRGSIERVLPAMRTFVADAPHLNCLDLMDFIDLTPATALIGHGCWGDGGYGDFFNSRIMLNDWKVIEELRFWQRGPWRLQCMNRCGACEEEVMKRKVELEDLDRESIAEQLRVLGQRAGAHSSGLAPSVGIQKARRAVDARATFRSSLCAHENQLGGVGAHAGCKAAGDVIEEIMEDHPEGQLLILSGHVHSASCIQVSRNIEQRTASAAYGQPKIEDLIELPTS